MKKIIAKLALLAVMIAPIGAALPAVASSNPLICFDGVSDATIYGGNCSIVSGTATLNNTDGNVNGDYSGVYTASSTLSGKTLAEASTDQLSFTYTGTPTAGSPRISLPIDLDANGTTDVYAFIGANLCNDGAGLVDAINNPSCKIFITGGDVGGYTGWAAFEAAFPLAKVSSGVPFIVADDVGLWTVSNIHLGSEVAALSAEDFGVVNYNTGVTGQLKGYTAGFGLTGATLAGATSVVVQLFASSTLLQTNTAILSKFNADITGTQFSSPFDVSGTFAYATDGYWTNVKEAQYGQGLAATRVVATVTLANGLVVTAENTNLTGDPATVFSLTAPTITTPANGATVTTADLVKIDWTDVTGGTSPYLYQYQAFSDSAYTALIYDSGMTLSASEISTTGTPPGVYYVRVMAKDAIGTLSDWSNGASNPYMITVVANPPTVLVATTKTQCMSNGWKNYTDGTNHFKNQGDCVSFVATKGKNKAAGN